MTELYQTSCGAKLAGSSSAPWYLVILKETHKKGTDSTKLTFLLSNER